MATLGRPGPAWPRAVARWGSSATLPLDTTTCVSADELRALVASTPIGLAIVEAGMPGVDRVLAAEVRQAGAALAVVDGPALGPAVERLEPDAVLPPEFDADALSAVLRSHARSRAPIPPAAPAASDEVPADLLAVTGTPGAGASTVAQALATALAATGPTLLADLALDADQHLRHGVPPGADGVFELADALRHQRPGTIEPPVAPQPSGYDLLCGLRRPQEWVALSGSVAEQLVEVLRRERANVVADVSSEVDGRAETGSLDLEDRNALARTVVRQATVVVVVGRGTTTGVPRLVRLLTGLERHGVDRHRLRPVLNGVPRRSAASRSLAELLGELGGEPWPTAVALAHDRRVEARLREARPLPSRLVTRVAALGSPP